MRLDYLEEDVPVLVCLLGVSLLVVQKLVYFAAWMEEYLESCERLLRFRAYD